MNFFEEMEISTKDCKVEEKSGNLIKILENHGNLCMQKYLHFHVVEADSFILYTIFFHMVISLSQYF